MKTHTIESRFALGAENILFAGVCVPFSARTFFRLGQWRELNYNVPNARVVSGQLLMLIFQVVGKSAGMHAWTGVTINTLHSVLNWTKASAFTCHNSSHKLTGVDQEPHKTLLQISLGDINVKFTQQTFKPPQIPKQTYLLPRLRFSSLYTIKSLWKLAMGKRNVTAQAEQKRQWHFMEGYKSLSKTGDPSPTDLL